jgi:3-keto-5-aminohexanoate cleavage enzyme
MSEPCIITVAITGSVPRKKDNPAVPISIEEQVESTHEAYEAGASIVHVHVRDEEEKSSSDVWRFEKLQNGIRKHCPDIIIQFSTGGRGRSLEQRGAMLHLKPDMASLATGSVNFPTIVYENPPDFIRTLAKTMLDNDVKPEIEIFDLAMLYNAAELVTEGLLRSPVHVQFVFGVKHALPARREILLFELEQLRMHLPDATWTAAGIGRHQLEVNHWALQLGGHCRTGLEDNVR